MPLLHLQFQDNSTEPSSAVVSPLGLFSIIDHFTRCDVAEKTIGLLLGSKHNNTVTINQTIPLKYTTEPEEVVEGEEIIEENEALYFDWELAESMIQLQSEIANDEIVGWYMAGGSASDSVVHLIHQQISTHLTPELLFLFTDIESLATQQQFPIQVFAPTAVGVDESIGFVEIKSTTNTAGEFAQIQDIINNNAGNTSRESELEGLRKNLKTVLGYVEQLEALVEQSDESVIRSKGRHVMDALLSLPRLDRTTLQKVLQNNELESLRKVVDITQRQLKISQALQAM